MGFLIFILLFFTITSAQNTNNNIISPGSTLYASNPNITWSSPNKLVSLSFIPATSSSQNTFIAAILYDEIPIWQPITTAVDSTAEFRFLSSGNLILTNQTNHNFWESNTNGMNVTHAEIQDSGNLVLSSKLNDSVSVWSTFDHPTDTIVPTQNFTTRNILTNGVYSFNLVSPGNITLTWNHNIVYWNLGNSSFDGNLTSLTLSLQKIGILSISDPMLSSPAIMAYSSDYAEGNGDDIFRFLKLDSDGNLRIYSSNRNSKSPMVRWSAVLDQCQVFGYCGKNGICSYNDTDPVCGCASKNFDPIDPNDSRKGCERKVELADCPSDVVMLELSHTQFLTYPPETTSQVFFTATAACKGNCLSGSNLCNASTSLSDGTGLCYMKTSDFISGYQSPALPSTSYFKVCGPVDLNPSSSSSLDPDEDKSWRLPVWIVAVVVVSTLLGLVMFELVIWWCCCKNSNKFGGLTAQYALLEYASGAPVQFSYKELNRATKGFKEKLGEGGFGVVYKGVLANRTVAAVKQLEGIEQGEKQFRMEVATISSTHHLNLVRLIGFCSEGRHRLLVYEFMKNGSLDKFLFTAEMGKLLSWENRFNILLGTARGITYLHEECRDCIVHCDIKPENILLDENYNAKVSDFGLAKLINPKDHRYRTLTSVRGTRGYLAPEWLANLPITSKSDVYSYGMVLLETVSGKRNFEVSEATNRKKFSVWAYEEYERGNVTGIVDKRVVGDQKEVNMEQVTRVIQVSFWCIQEQPSHRPTMGKVVQMLEGITEMDKPPAPKAFTDGSFSSLSIVGASAPPPSSSSSSRHATTGISSYISAKNMDRASSSLRESQNLNMTQTTH